MRSFPLVIAGLGLALAACGPTQSGGRGMPAGAPTAGTGTISPIQGQNSVPPQRSTPGVPSAGTGTISPIQGQSDVGRDSTTRP